MVRLERMCQPFPQALYEACLTTAFLSSLHRPDTSASLTLTSLGHLQDQELGASSQQAMLATGRACTDVFRLQTLYFGLFCSRRRGDTR